MTQSAALEMINGAKANGGLSNYTGTIEMYTGYADPALNFNGGGGASLLDAGTDAEPFILSIVNAHANPRSFFLSQGLLYVRGAETAGQLKTGTFAAPEDIGGATSLTASTTNPITIEQFVEYTRQNPSFIPFINATSDQATKQLSVSMTKYKQGPIKNEVAIVLPFRRYAKQDAFQQQYFDITDHVYVSKEHIFQIFVAGGSTLTLNIYLLASHSTSKQLENKVNSAKTTVARHGADVINVDRQIKQAHAALPM